MKTQKIDLTKKCLIRVFYPDIDNSAMTFDKLDYGDAEKMFHALSRISNNAIEIQIIFIAFDKKGREIVVKRFYTEAAAQVLNEIPY